MTTYSEWTQQVGDQWVAAIERAGQALTQTAAQMAEAAPKYDLPAVELPEQIQQFTDAIASNYPNPTEVIEANYELTTRLLAAQRELTLQVIELGKAAAAK